MVADAGIAKLVEAQDDVGDAYPVGEVGMDAYDAEFIAYAEAELAEPGPGPVGTVNPRPNAPYSAVGPQVLLAFIALPIRSGDRVRVTVEYSPKDALAVFVFCERE